MYLEFAGSITIEATIGQMSKATYSGNATSFTAGDSILLYGWTGSSTAVPALRAVDGVANRFDGTAWIPESTMYWDNVKDSHYFLGIYPVPDRVTSFTAAAYKLNTADYAASDLLIATNLSGVKAAGGPVRLNFEHVMSKLIVNLKFRNEFGGTPAVSSVTVTACDNATVNYLTKEVTATGTKRDLSLTAQASAPAGYSLSFSGLQIPQNGVRRIAVTIGTQVFEYESDTDIPLNAGAFTTLGLIVGKDKIELNTVTVTEWTAGTNLAGGEAVMLNPYNGHGYVDLGLPSGLKWATCNVGASAPDDYGDYFAWGETTTKTDYSWDTYFYCDEGWRVVKYLVPGSEVLEADDDAASANWGGLWRMPTKAEFDELLTNCNWTWKTTSDGYSHNGYLVSATNGNSIFLPAAGGRCGTSLSGDDSYGVYWSSCLGTDSMNASAWALSIHNNEHNIHGGYMRNCGQPVRPVCP